MPAEFSSNAAQDVPANSGVIFTETTQPCTQGLIYHKNGSAIFRVANKFSRQNIINNWRRNTNYVVSFHANIGVPTGGTAEAISLAVAIDGEVDPSTIMTFTPTAVGDLGNVGAETLITVPYVCMCSNVSIRNISAQTVTVQNANLVIEQGG